MSRSVFGWNYPAGADTPDAPWNQKDEFECSECRQIVSEVNDKDQCPDCEGTWFCLNMVVWVKAENEAEMKKLISKRLDGSSGEIDFVIEETIEDESP